MNDIIKQDKTAVVIFSGGQDSTTCLGLALKHFKTVHCIIFEYGQKHHIETNQAQLICLKTRTPYVICKIPALAMLADSALTGAGDINDKHHRNTDLPASYVPNRNALFVTTAHAFAQKVGADTIITGVCQTDYSGYPDCREKFIVSLQDTLNLGYETNIKILTPLMHLTKAATFALAEKVGVLDLVLDYSHTCYLGERGVRHDWGFGCGQCPACEIRKKGWSDYMQKLTEENEQRYNGE